MHAVLFVWLLAVQSASGLLPQRTPLQRQLFRTSHRRNFDVALLADSAPTPAGADGPFAQLGRTAVRVRDFVDRRYFLVGVVGAVAMAAVAPGIGRKGGILRPELTVAWGATCGIFLLAGLSLPTNQLKAAALQWREHIAIQSYNLVAIPLAMYGLCAALRPLGLLEQALLDGMLVMAALPTTVNMCVALTRSSNGNEALSIFNAVLGNLFGVVLTPALLLFLVGRTGTISILDTLKKLMAKVLLPLFCGQILRGVASDSLAKRPSSKKVISRTSESLLLLTVYSTFCDTFLRGFGLPASKLFTLFLLVTGTHAGFLAAAWAFGGMLKLRAADRVAVLLASTQKTLALGLPLLSLIFAGRPDLGLLCTPLLIQHPLQLIVGSVLTPRLKQYVAEHPDDAKAV